MLWFIRLCSLFSIIRLLKNSNDARPYFLFHNCSICENSNVMVNTALFTFFNCSIIEKFWMIQGPVYFVSILWKFECYDRTPHELKVSSETDQHIFTDYSCFTNITMASVNKVFVFSAAVRGFHVYRETWNPTEQEKLCCLFEENNVFDMFAIKTLHADGRTTVGHLPREISRPTKFLLDRGAKVEAELSATHYRRSPLFQGGLEIPCLVLNNDAR